ncbi:unnamed protein product [Aphis gossypii]|uniref:Uncharacterized protein n=1 Tax=Aphis gossypii TaxID=80765 RepID=A0A9P0JAY7_APHGO|nr:unnamed protein product [Aphis gossypii]
MDVKELRFNGDHQIDENGLSDQDEAPADIIIKKITISDECYVNKGFTDSNSLKEESSNKIWEDSNQLSKNVILISDGPLLTTQDGYINNAFEDGPQKAEKRTKLQSWMKTIMEWWPLIWKRKKRSGKYNLSDGIQIRV